MTIDVVIPSYNRLDIIFLTIDSVVKQTLKPRSIIIVDDNSDYDESEFNERLSALKNNSVDIFFIRNSENRGACYSRNRGAKLSSSEYIAFLDDDDLWEPEHLNNLYEKIKIEKSILAYSGKKIRDFETKKERISYKKIPNVGQFKALLKCNYPGSTSSILVERESLMLVGGFDESLPAIQDYDFYLRLIKVGSFSSCSVPTLIYRNDTPLKITNQIKKGVDAAQIIISKYDGHNKLTLNKTLTCQNLKKCIRYFNFSCIFDVINNFKNNRL